MALSAELLQQVERALSSERGGSSGAGGGAATGSGRRLRDDAQRLWQRVQHFLAMGLIDAGPDTDPLELACYALQLPRRPGRGAPAGSVPRAGLRERAEQAAELLANALADHIPESLLERTSRLLQELPQRSPRIDGARLLADVVNLDDFGVSGLLLHAMQAARQGEGLAQVLDGAQKREQYGYWEARLKDGFHYEPARQAARRRIESARQLIQQLRSELAEEKS